MLSKEEREKAKECLQETIQNTYAEGKAIKLNNVLKYIAQLESEKQNLIEKLERDIKNNQISFNHIYNISTADIEKNAICNYAKEILKILKGENYDN